MGCHADGASAAESDNTNCDGAGLTAPTSATVCCAAADPDMCVAAPPPGPPEQQTEETDDKLVLWLVLAGVGVVLVIVGLWYHCKTDDSPPGKTKEQLQAELEETRRKQDAITAATGP